MIDRNVEFPNRFRMTLVPGTDDIYEVVPAPGDVVAEGDTFSKANMLPDAIPALLGLKMANPQVKDALNVLANIGNVHVWERVQTYSEPVPEVPAGYTLGAVEENVLIAKVKNSMVNASNGKMVVVYSENVDVSNDGDVSMPSDASSIEGFLTAVPNNFSSPGDKYVRYENSTYGSIIFNVSDIVYLPADSVYSVTEDDLYNYLYVSKLQRVTGYPYTPAIPAGTHVDYLTSTDPDAYPDNVSDAQDAHYVLGPAVTGNFKLSANYNSSSIFHALSITVDDDGNVSLVNAVEVPASKYDDTLVNALKGRFVTADSTDIYSAFENGATIYIPNDASINRTSGLTISKYQPVTGYPAIPANTVITYLGQLGEPGARIEVGSYVGTGTYGADNKNSYTFQNRPIMFCLFGKPINGNGVITILWGQNSACSVSETYAAGFHFDSISWNGNTVSWYAGSKNDQANYAGEQYTIVAIR